MRHTKEQSKQQPEVPAGKDASLIQASDKRTESGFAVISMLHVRSIKLQLVCALLQGTGFWERGQVKEGRNKIAIITDPTATRLLQRRRTAATDDDDDNDDDDGDGVNCLSLLDTPIIVV